jgi:hypothetical protein
MALSSKLTKFRAPGTKILTEVVQSTPNPVAPQGARILVINSRKGEVNKLVLVSTFEEYVSKFDGISDADERRGNWSARSAQYMLTVAPIYVLNLRSFDDTKDLAGIQELSLNPDVANSEAKEVSYTSLYNTQQFWKVEPSQLIKQDNADKLLVFGNVGTQNLSVFVRKSINAEFDLTFEQWYKNLGREIPSYVNPFDKVSDWMVDVVIFENKFTTESSSNPNYGYCFNEDGTVRKSVVNAANQKIDGLTQLSRIPESGYSRTVTGSLVQGFKDASGNNLDVVKAINGLVQLQGLIAQRNERIFDNAGMWVEGDTVNSNGKKKPVPFDFAGHNLCNITEVGTFDVDAFTGVDSVNVASYSFASDVQDILMEAGTMDSNAEVSSNGSHLLSHNVMFPANVANGNVSIAKYNELYVFEALKPSLGDKYVGNDGNLASVVNVNFVGQADKFFRAGTMDLPVQPYGDDVNFADSHDWESADGADDTFKYANPGTVFPLDGTQKFYVYPVDHVLAGEALVFDATTEMVVHNPKQADVANYIFQKDDAGQDITPDWENLPVGYTPGAVQLIQLSDFSVEKINADDTVNDTTKYQDLNSTFGKKVNVYKVTFDKQLVVNVTGDQSVTPDMAPKAVTNADYITLNDGEKLPFFANNLVAFRVSTFDQMADKFAPIALKSYTPRSAQFLDGTATRQNEVLDTLLNTGLKKALANRDLSTWNYIVDGFKSFIEPNCKYQLKEVAKERKIGRAICNTPSINDFIYSTDPYFRDEINGQFDPKYITTGGNKELPHSNSFSLPSDSGEYAYFFGPNLTHVEGKLVPPASLASNAFARKYLVGKPYMIVAGDDGLITGRGITGVEYTFSESESEKGDRDFLNPFGYNVILNKGTNGLQIYGNRTAQNTVETPMSSIHTSEVVMYIQERINKLLERYVFKYNIARNRMVIKEEADAICREPLADGAISGFENQIDEFNNTREVINNRIGILDTVLYDNNGMEILVHRTKIDQETNTASFEVL